MAGPRVLQALEEWLSWSDPATAALTLGEAVAVLLPLVVYALRSRDEAVPGERWMPYLVAAAMVVVRCALAVADHIGDAAPSRLP